MKQRICLLLTIALLFTSLLSCASDIDNSEQLIDRYNQALALYDTGYEAAVAFRMTVGTKKASGEFRVKVAGDDCTIERQGSTDARYYVDGVSYRRGYFLGDVYYTDSDSASAKIKETTSRDAFIRECASFFCINPYVEFFPALTAEDLENASYSESNGKTALSVPLRAEAVEAYLAGNGVTVSDGALTAVFDEIGDMEELVLYLVVTMNGEATVLDITYRFQNRGAIPAVLKPQNADDYIER